MNRSIAAIAAIAVAVIIVLGSSPAARAQVNEGATFLSPTRSPGSAEDRIGTGSSPTLAAASEDTGQSLGLVGHLGGGINGLAVRDDFAYITEDGHFSVIDVSDRTSPTIVSVTSPDSRLCGSGKIVLQGDYAYTTGTCGLRVLRIADPHAVAKVGFFNTPGMVDVLSVDGNRAYLADRDNGLYVLDITNPANPVELGTYPVNTPALGYIATVTASGNYAYVSSRDGVVHVLDVEVPSDIRIVASISSTGEVADMQIQDNRLYVTRYSYGLQILDISDPANPVSLLSYVTGRWGSQIELDGNHAYITTAQGDLDVVDLTDHASPVKVGTYNQNGEGLELAVVDGYVYLAGHPYRGGAPTLTIVDVKAPSSPVRVGQYDSPRASIGLDVRGNHAFVADRIDGLKVLDVSNPALPRQIGSHALPGYTIDVVVDDSYAYVISSEWGMTIFNITDPSRPGIVAGIATPDGGQEIAKSGNHVYISGGWQAGLLIMDVSNPGKPVQAAHITRPIYSVKVDGKYAYTVDDRGLRIYDISRPSAPAQVGYLDMRGKLNSIAIRNGFVYGATESGIKILNVTKPSKPRVVATLTPPRNVYSVAISGNRLYANGDGDLYVIDLTDPTRPLTVGLIDSVGGEVAAEGDTVFVLDYYGLSIYGRKTPGLNIGEGVIGDTSTGDMTTTIYERGGDIYGTADAFRYVFQVGVGDYEYTSRITAWNPAGVSTAKAGIMFRASTAPGAPHITAHITGPTGALKLKWRSAAGGTTSNFNGPAATSLPVWLRLVKSGSSVTAYFSGDGKAWTQLGSPQEIAAVSDGFLYGMALTSNSPVTQASATFAASPQPSPVITGIYPTSGPVGSVVRITGTNIASATDVAFNRLKADFTVVSPTRVDAVVPLGANTGKVMLATSRGMATGESDFTVTAPPAVLYFSPSSNIVSYDMTFSSADIVSHTRDTYFNVRNVLYDGSAAGTPKDLESFSFVADDIILGFSAAQLIPGVGKSLAQDLVRFTPTRLGYNNTAGTFSWYFDGSDVGLATGSEAIDALWIDSIGRLYISTTGSGEVPVNTAIPNGGKFKFEDEDVLRFTPSASSTGAATVGVWELYWDPSLMPGMLAADLTGYYEDGITGHRYITLLDPFTIGSDQYGKVTGRRSSIVRLIPSAAAPGGWAPVESVNWAGEYPEITDELDALELSR